MKIALVAPLMLTLPVQTYGGVERIIESLAQGLAERGHEVTVFSA